LILPRQSNRHLTVDIIFRAAHACLDRIRVLDADEPQNLSLESASAMAASNQARAARGGRTAQERESALRAAA
jgi:hypothetical protein